MDRRPVPHLSGRKLLAHGTAYLANCTVITGASLVSGVTRQDTTLRPASDFSPASLLCMSTLASVRIVNVPSAVPFGPPSDLIPGIGDSRADPTKPDRKSVVSGKCVSVRVDLGGRRIFKKKKERIQ